MSKWIGLLALALIAGPTAAGAEAPRGVFHITNASTRYVECTVVMDGDTWTNIKIPTGESYSEEFRANRRLQLVCMRAREDVYGPLKLGVDYRFVDHGGNRVDLVSPDGPVPVGPS